VPSVTVSCGGEEEVLPEPQRLTLRWSRVNLLVRLEDVVVVVVFVDGLGCLIDVLVGGAPNTTRVSFHHVFTFAPLTVRVWRHFSRDQHQSVPICLLSNATRLSSLVMCFGDLDSLQVVDLASSTVVSPATSGQPPPPRHGHTANLVR
jgi:hypothetical protein